jgi:hypothetical protein
LVSAEKYASAIEQKKILVDDTSTNGSVMLAPPHVPFSARISVDAAVIITTAAMSHRVRLRILVLILILLPG